MSEGYAHIAPKARLDLVKLVHSEFELSHEFKSTEPLSLEIGNRWVEQSYLEAQSVVLGVCEWLFHCFVESERDEPRVRVEARYLVRYSEVEESSIVAQEFLRDVGRMAAYPYFRGHVAMNTGAAGLVLPPLPSINIGTFRKRDKLVGSLGQKRRARPNDSSAQ